MSEPAQEYPHLQTDGTELRDAVGLEERESTASLLRVSPGEVRPR
jgi:hypothetical protein